MLSLLSDEKKNEKGGIEIVGGGEWFHWPLDCVSNIFRVCSGERLSLCSLHLSRVLVVQSSPACEQLLAVSIKPHSSGDERAPSTMPDYWAIFATEREPVMHLKRVKMDNAGIKSLNFRGLERQHCFLGPQTSGAFQHHGKRHGKSTPGQRLPNFLCHVNSWQSSNDESQFDDI